MTEGYVTHVALDENDEVIGYEYVNFGKMMDAIKQGVSVDEALKSASGTYGRFDEAVKVIDPREE